MKSIVDVVLPDDPGEAPIVVEGTGPLGAGDKNGGLPGGGPGPPGAGMSVSAPGLVTHNQSLVA